MILKKIFKIFLSDSVFGKSFQCDKNKKDIGIVKNEKKMRNRRASSIDFKEINFI